MAHITHRLRTAVAASVAACAAALAVAPANAATTNTATTNTAMTNTAPARAAGPVAHASPADDFTWDFRVPGVRIFQQPTADSAVVGLGYPGQLFIGPGGSPSPDYQCDNGVVSHTFEQGTDQVTGVSGWVPLCNLVLP